MFFSWRVMRTYFFGAGDVFDEEVLMRHDIVKSVL